MNSHLKKLIKVALLITGIGLTTLLPATGQEADSTVKKSFSFTGFADIYYQYDFNRPASKRRPGFIYNHKKLSQPSLNLALLKAVYEKKKWKAALGLMAGDYATYNLAAEPALARYIYEATISYGISKRVSADAGIFPSHIGLESAITKDNITVSRSLLAENSPYYETGMRLNIKLSGRASVSLLALNGWQRIRDNNRSWSFGTQVQLKPDDKSTINGSLYYGNDTHDSTSKRNRLFFNFYATRAFSPKISFTWGYDWGEEENGTIPERNTWGGWLLQLQWKPAPKASIAARFEYYRDKKGVIISPVAANGFKTSGYTLSAGWQITKNMAWRNELRLLQSPDPLFESGSGSQKQSLALLSSFSLWFDK